MKIFFTLLFITCSLAVHAQKKSINVRTLGVAGNGQTDDTQALQKAIDYCGQHGYDVYIPAGTYMVSAVYPRHCLKVAYDGMEVKGDGDRTVLKNKDNNPNAGILLVEAADPDHKQIKGVRIDNFKIDGNKQNQTGKYEQKCLRINVSNTINEPADIVVYNMTCINAYSGVLPTEGGGISLEGWDKSLRNDVMLRQNIEVYNCVCNDNGGWGIGTNWSSGFNIHNNITEGNATMGITVWNSMNGTVQNNTANNNHDNDINLEVSDNIVVERNTIASSAGGGGIKSHNCIHTLISNNNITFNNEWYLSYGIAVASGIGFGEGGNFKKRPSADIKIINNRVICKGGQGTGIRVYAYPEAPYKENVNITIENNTVQNSVTGKCMEVYGSSIFITGNSTIGNIYLNGKTLQSQDKKKRNLLQEIFSLFGI